MGNMRLDTTECLCQIGMFTFSITSFVLLFVSKEVTNRKEFMFPVVTTMISSISTASFLLGSLFECENSTLGKSKPYKIIKFTFFLSLSCFLVISGLLVILRCSSDYCDGGIVLNIAGLTTLLTAIFGIFQVYFIRPCSVNFEVEDEYSKNQDYHPARNSTMVINV